MCIICSGPGFYRGFFTPFRFGRYLFSKDNQAPQRKKQYKDHGKKTSLRQTLKQA